MLTCKTSVRFKNFTPALFYILHALEKCDKEFPGDIVITSVNDSTHKKGSAHYRDEGVDIRCNDRNDDFALVARLTALLGPSFFILHESGGTPNEHIHIQLRIGHIWNKSY